MEDWESDSIVEKWIQEHDQTFMPLPSIEYKPHLLISKVRKHYMEYLIKLLAINYEKNQKLLNKNIYLPSAIWRCAKMMEKSAAQDAMVVQIYRNSIAEMIKGLKKSTSNGLLYRKLYDCLHYAPENEKKTQTTISRSKDCNCQCYCNQRKKVKRICESPEMSKSIGVHNNNNILPQIPNSIVLPGADIVMVNKSSSPKPSIKNSMDVPVSDELMVQLDKLFQGEETDDDLFDSALCLTDNSKISDEYAMPSNIMGHQVNLSIQQENQESQECPNERLALISSTLVNNTDTSAKDPVYCNNEKSIARTSKWLCEEYFQKVKLYELLDQIRDCDRKKFTRVKKRLFDLFGDDSDDEGVVSPLEESKDFITSCKERIAPWIVKILTPYYVKGRIIGKALFKSLVRHLIRLIYQCSKYPHEYEVQSFINDFLDNHKMIRCEADFKQFRIENC